MVNRNVTIGRRRTSLRLEPAMWDALEEICRREEMNQHELCTMIDERRRASSLTAAVRVFVIGYFRAAATEEGLVVVVEILDVWRLAGVENVVALMGETMRDRQEAIFSSVPAILIQRHMPPPAAIIV